MTWTPAQVSEVLEFFRLCALRAKYNDGSYEDQLLQKLMRVFWNVNRFPVQISKEKRGTCRVA